MRYVQPTPISRSTVGSPANADDPIPAEIFRRHLARARMNAAVAQSI
jgi:hypothetical protein